jgi:hypothetical protein
MERLLQGLRGLLRLTAVTRKALLCGAAALSSFRVVFDGSCGEGHDVLLCSVGIFGDGGLSKCT